MKSTPLNNSLRFPRFGRSTCGLFFALCLILLFVHNLHGESPLANAQQLEKAGDKEGAARLLSAWLDANPGAPDSPPVFEEYLRVEQDLPALLAASGRFLQSARGIPGSAAQFEKIARLYDMAGRIEAARDAYVSAHAEGGADADLVSAFLLSLEMNDAGSMSSNLEQLAGKGESAGLLLRALVQLRAGEPAGRATLVSLSDQTGNPDVALRALWMLYEEARSRGDAPGQAAARAKLGARFAASPEAVLAAGPSPASAASPRSIAVQLPAPGPFDAGDGQPKADSASPKADSATAASGAPAARTPGTQVETPTVSAETTPGTQKADPVQAAPGSSPVVSVQAGSFLVEENANDLVNELTRRGFSPVVVHEFAKGRDRYRVLAGSGLEAEAAQEVMKRLSDAGFGGFIVQDK
ncbi:MAG: SPOR domain-containing protein [Spirochaetia bacterium]